MIIPSFRAGDIWPWRISGLGSGDESGRPAGSLIGPRDDSSTRQAFRFSPRGLGDAGCLQSAAPRDCSNVGDHVTLRYFFIFYPAMLFDSSRNHGNCRKFLKRFHRVEPRLKRKTEFGVPVFWVVSSCLHLTALTHSLLGQTIKSR